jgi:hypothetical protein
MRSSTLSTLAAIGALSFPSTNAATSKGVQDPHSEFSSISLPAVSGDVGFEGIGRQDPKKPEREGEKEMQELRQRLAVSEVTLNAALDENKLLRRTQEAFNRIHRFGSPLEHEAALRYEETERLSSIEAEMKKAVSPEIRKMYAGTIDAIFSDVIIDRDKGALEQFLRGKFPQQTEEELKTQVGSFVDSMSRWRDFLKRDEMIQRLHATTHGVHVAVVPGIPDEARAFLAPPSPEQVTILAAVSNEYVTAKALALKRILKSRGANQPQTVDNSSSGR